VGDGVADDYAAISAALSAAIAGGKQLMFPPGIYRHSGVLNFGSERLRIFGTGTARLRYTGSASAGVLVQFTGGGGNDIIIENLWFEGNGNTTGLYIENAVRSVFKNIRIGNVTDYGVLVLGGVLDLFENIVVSLNDTPYYPGIWTSFPKYGIYLNNSSLITQTTDCTFINPIIELVSEAGIYLEDAANNTFIGGTSEGNTGTGGTWDGVGIIIQSNSPNNVFINMFCEQNKNGDLICYGKNNEFVNCAMTSRAATSPFNAVKSIIIKNGAEQNRIRGGQAYSCTVESGAIANVFERCEIADVVSDSGTRTQVLWTKQGFITSDIVPGWTAGNLATAGTTVLDWYEEGTFTPTFGGSTSDGTVSFDVQVGRYTRIGDIVNFQLIVRVSAITSAPTGDLLVRGLPFIPNGALNQPVIVGDYNNITLPVSYVQMTGYAVAATPPYIRLVGVASGLASSLVQGSGLGASALINISGLYKVA
jgi:hypothetical protein